jgi:hypothetical protein
MYSSAASLANQIDRFARPSFGKVKTNPDDVNAARVSKCVAIDLDVRLLARGKQLKKKVSLRSGANQTLFH